MELLYPREWRAFPGVVHVVSVPLDCLEPGALTVLDEEERARAARFAFDRDRFRFITAHAYLRLLLGGYLGQPAPTLRFAAGARGKPCLLDAATDARFNLSHSGDRALIAISTGIEVGVDIEQARPDGLLDLARQFFAPGEVAALEALSPRDQPGALIRGWTRKEAFIKALGDGLSFPLDRFEVSLAADASGQLLRSCTADARATARWRLLSVAAPAGYAAAVAAEGADWHLVQWTCARDSAGTIQLRQMPEVTVQ